MDLVRVGEFVLSYLPNLTSYGLPLDTTVGAKFCFSKPSDMAISLHGNRITPISLRIVPDEYQLLASGTPWSRAQTTPLMRDIGVVWARD